MRSLKLLAIACLVAVSCLLTVPSFLRVVATTHRSAVLDLNNTFTGTNTFGAIVATGISGLTSPITPNAAGGTTLGTAALPFGSLVIGASGTHALTTTPASFAAGVTATVDDPGFTAVKAPLIRRGTIAWTTALVASGACTAAQTDTQTGLATTAVIWGNPNADDANYDKGLVMYWYPTSSTVNLKICNPTAGSLTPTGATITFNYVAIVP